MERIGQLRQAQQTEEPETKKPTRPTWPTRQARLRLRAVVTMTVVYALQFLLLPLLLGAYFPGASNEATAIFWLSAALGLSLGFRFADQRLLSWLIADAFYLALILLYCAEGAYGIGMRGISLDGMHTYFDPGAVSFGALICFGEVLVIQLILKGLCCAARRLRRKAC